MAIVTKTYIDKTNTIIKDNAANTGLNPVMELNYGQMLSRCIIYFDHAKVQRMVEDKTYPDINKLRHILKFTNASSIPSHKINEPCFDSEYNAYKERAISFDLIFFLIPQQWDEGRGFDYSHDLYNRNHRAVSTQASNWYNAKTYTPWHNEGIYTTEKLSHELDLFTSKEGNKSKIIIGYEHFDFGTEPIHLDITDIFNKFITNELPNYGIGIAFSPKYENQKTKLSQYVGFFTPHTHSFFEPYVETTYCETIEDDRAHFYLDKDNKLYFYAFVGGKAVNMDNNPICVFNGVEYPSKQATKGVYYIDINLSSDDYDYDTMYYDTWTNLSYKGRNIPDVELQFITQAPEGYFTFGLPSQAETKPKIEPSLYGINFKESIKRGDIRKVNVECLIPYTSNQEYAVDNLEYRLYITSGVDEIDVIKWTKVERTYLENYFYINTNELLPTRYYIDIKVKYDYEEIIHYKKLEFDIVNDQTEVYV